MKIKSLVAGLVGTVIVTSAAQAGDTPMIAPAPAPIVIAPPVPTIDWSGVYVGASYVVGGTIDFQFGYNLVRGNFLAGTELIFGAINVGTWTFYAGLVGRAGFLVGAHDRALLYGAAEVRYVPAVSGVAIFGMGGLEVKVGRRLSVFGEGGLSATGVGGLAYRAGINMHFGD